MPPRALANSESPPDWATERARYEARIAELQRRIAWFQRQLFGEKSERRHIEPPPEQMALGEGIGAPVPAAPSAQPVAAHTRRLPAKPDTDAADEGLFFDPARVPVETIEVPSSEIADLPPEAYEVVGEKVTHRLAQRPGSYVVLKYVRKVVKLKAAQTLLCPPGPARGVRPRARRRELPRRVDRR